MNRGGLAYLLGRNTRGEERRGDAPGERRWMDDDLFLLSLLQLSFLTFDRKDRHLWPAASVSVSAHLLMEFKPHCNLLMETLSSSCLSNLLELPPFFLICMCEALSGALERLVLTKDIIIKILSKQEILLMDLPRLIKKTIGK